MLGVIISTKYPVKGDLAPSPKKSFRPVKFRLIADIPSRSQTAEKGYKSEVEETVTGKAKLVHVLNSLNHQFIIYQPPCGKIIVQRTKTERPFFTDNGKSQSTYP